MPKEHGRGIPEPRLTPEKSSVRFSFKHIDIEHDKFHFSKCQTEFFEKLICRFRIFSTWSIEQFTDQNNNERRHTIWFPDTSEPEGFTNIDSEQLGVHEAWQFAICPDDQANQWRVHGILIDDTFFVVWLDPEHKLYSNRLEP